MCKMLNGGVDSYIFWKKNINLDQLFYDWFFYRADKENPTFVFYVKRTLQNNLTINNLTKANYEKGVLTIKSSIQKVTEKKIKINKYVYIFI